MAAHFLSGVERNNRRGEAVILVVRSKAMYNDGFAFFLSDNGVWLTDHVPVKYIDF
ncbi:MAG TPA: RNA 2'-phosphotransferase [Puia sp.]|nr:RNA 2'-phosphotransferase [Puia sp.]